MSRLIILIVVLILLFLFLAWEKNNNLLAGLWKADSSFCDSAKIDSLYLFIESNSSPSKNLVLTVDGKIIDGSATFIPIPTFSLSKTEYKLSAKLDGWPDDVNIVMDYLQNMLTVYTSETEYGIFHKVSGPSQEENS
jgi:hypothetical protein